MWQRHGGEVLNQPRLARGADAVAPGLGIDTRVARPRREIATGERDRGRTRAQGGCDGGWRDERQGELAKLEVIGVLEEHGRCFTWRYEGFSLLRERSARIVRMATGPVRAPPPGIGVEQGLPSPIVERRGQTERVAERPLRGQHGSLRGIRRTGPLRLGRLVDFPPCDDSITVAVGIGNGECPIPAHRVPGPQTLPASWAKALLRTVELQQPIPVPPQ